MFTVTPTVHALSSRFIPHSTPLATRGHSAPQSAPKVPLTPSSGSGFFFVEMLPGVSHLSCLLGQPHSQGPETAQSLDRTINMHLACPCAPGMLLHSVFAKFSVHIQPSL